MDFNIGDIVRHATKGVGTVELVDGIAVWVRWLGGEITHTGSFNLDILDKSV